MSRWARLLPLLILAGCTSRNPPPPTLAKLEPAPAPPAAQTGLKVDRAAAIRAYEAFLASARDPERRAQALQRLADLKLEQAEAELENDAGKQANGDAIALYEQRLREHPNAADNDRVLYQLARAYENAGRRADAERVLDRLVAKPSRSGLLAEAQFRRGENLFVARDYRGAEAAYSAVIAAGAAGDFYAPALYKRGWAQFKQSLYPEAIDDFVRLMDLRATGGALNLEGLPRAEREQLEDALRAVSLAFAYQDGPASVGAYYASRGHRRHQDLVYAGLGELYLTQERYTDAAASLEAFVRADPTHARAPAAQLRAIEIYGQGGFPSQVLAGKARFVELYRLGGPFWAGRERADHPQVTAALKSTLADLARHYHALAQRGRQAEDYQKAFGWYRDYLQGFGDDPAAQDTRFLYAELLFEHKDYAEAASQYEHAAYDYGDGGRAAEAGYAALLAFDARARELSGEAAWAWDSRRLASMQRFAAAFPQHPKAAPALTQAAEALFARNEPAAATVAAEALLNSQPHATEPQRLTAWTIVGHTAFDAGDFLKAEQAYRAVLDSPALVTAKRPPLAERLAASIYKQAEQRRAQGDLAGAVEDFLRVGRAAPATPIRAAAEYDAAALLIQLKAWPRAVAVLEDFRRDHPGHALQPEVTRRLAVAYLEVGQPRSAAQEFARISADADDPAVQREALLRAAELNEQVQDLLAAAELLEQYVARFPAPVEAAVEVRQRLVVLYQGLDPRRSRHWLAEIVKADRDAGGERSDRTRFLAAKASLVLAEDTLGSYREIRLIEPLKRSLKRKRDAMDKVLGAYTAAADYGVAEVTTAATFHIAEIYADFGRALLESERPGKLDEEAAEQYELMLEEEAFPFEEKAIALHELNVQRTAKGLYDDWIKRSFAALAKLLPARYAKTERQDELAETLQ